MYNQCTPRHIRGSPEEVANVAALALNSGASPLLSPHGFTLMIPYIGNAAILKGGKESACTAAAPARAIQAAFIQSVETRAEVAALLAQDRCISTLLSRAGATRSCGPFNTPHVFPSWGTRTASAIYPDDAADGAKAQRIVLNAKVCTCVD